MVETAGIRTFRVFLSSTFSDFQAERNSLHEKVFPRLRELCNSYGTQFQVVDLRWGITDAMANNQKTLETCLREIERCQQLTPKPNFLAMVGERYGWTPPPAQIPANEFETILDKSSPREQTLLKQWYKKDLNMLHTREGEKTNGCAIYELLPRTGKYLDWETWQPVETKLREILLQGAKKLVLPEDQFLKYYASATHQEIVKGALEQKESASHVQCFIRELAKIGSEEDKETYYELAPEKTRLLTKLKKTLQSCLPSENIHTFRPDFSKEEQKEDYLEAFCSAVYTQLRKQILDELAALEEVDEVTAECRQHEQFAQERAAVFVGRKKIVEQLVDYLTNPSQRQVLFVSGSTGTGKSAVLAYLIKEILAKKRTNIDEKRIHLLYRFLGTTKNSSDSSNFLRSLLQQLRKLNKIDLFSEKTYVSQLKLAESFKRSLQELPDDESFVFIIDALDQLIPEDKGRSTNWLPAKLPTNVKIICSYSTDAPDICSAVNRRINVTTLSLQQFTLEEAEEALTLLLEKAKRQLQPDQKDYLLNQFRKVGTPLYLKLAFDASLQWSSYNKDYSLVPTTKGLIKQLFNRLERTHGKPTIQKILSYLVSARFGLSETEILDLLSFDKSYFRDYYLQQIYHPLPEPRVPPIVWSLVYADLEQYLTVQGVANYPLITFFHRGFEEVIEKVYLASQSEKTTYHTILKDYFADQEIWLQSEKKREPNNRKLTEEIFQLFQNNEIQAIHDLLTDLDYLEAKSTAGMYFDLVKEFNQLITLNLSLSKVQKRKNVDILSYNQSRFVQAFLQFILNQGHVLVNYPQLLHQQALNQPDSSPVYQIAYNQLETENKPQIWIQWLNKPQIRDPCLRTLEGHNDWIYACAFSPDGTKILSGSRDSSLKLWDAQTGEELRTLEGHTREVVACAFSLDSTKILSISRYGAYKLWDASTGEELLDTDLGSVCSCAFSPDSTRILSASKDGSLKIWDATTGEELQEFEGHTTSIEIPSIPQMSPTAITPQSKSKISPPKSYNPVSACAFSPDGTKVISGAKDGTLKLWNVQTGEELRTLKGHTSNITACTFSKDGTKVLSTSSKIFGNESILKIWNVKTGEELGTIEGHNGSITACVFSLEDSKILSASSDKTLKLWDAQTGEELRTLEGHAEEVYACTFSPDGSQILSASRDRTLKLWDSATEEEQRALLKGHTHQVEDCVFSPNGSHILTASRDGTLKLWDATTGRERRTLKGHTSSVFACAFSPDGSKVLSGSSDKTLRLWNVQTGEELQTFEGHSDGVYTCTFSPDGSQILSASDNGIIRLLDVQTGEEHRTMKGHMDSVRACAFSPDGSQILSASRNEAKLWDVQTGEELQSFKGHTNDVSTCTISPDGTKILTASIDNTLKIWDTNTGTELRILTGHSSGVNTAKFSLDGTKVVSGSWDKTLKIWDINNGEELGTFVGLASIATVAWGNKHTIIAGEITGNVYVLEVHGLKSDPLFITLKYLYNIDEGQWERIPSMICPVCGYYMKITEDVLEELNIKDIQTLLGKKMNCPQCATPLQVNPFVIDRRIKN
ncbi:MAG: DUF4062 domain-containing protein [Candidatus Heimdallarchaeota archaeon]|nr:DUF4062 domain-containing protein [Candidatus Heimdallarchaeota archaeon]